MYRVSPLSSIYHHQDESRRIIFRGIFFLHSIVGTGMNVVRVEVYTPTFLFSGAPLLRASVAKSMTHQGFTCNVVGGILMMRSLIPSINVHISVLNCPHSRPHLSENQHQVREESHNQNDFSIYFEFSHYYPPPCLPSLRLRE